jgi:hypothetical protein
VTSTELVKDHRSPITYSTFYVEIIIYAAILAVKLMIGIVAVLRGSDPGYLVLSGIATIALLPFIIFGLVQFGALIVLAWLLLRGMRQWNTFTLAIGSLAIPIVAVLILSSVVPPLQEFSVTPFIIFALSFVVSGAVAYNDVKYRKPHAG